MKTAPVKTDRDNGSFSIISLTGFQEALSERQFGKQTCYTLSGDDVRAWSIDIDPYKNWGLNRCFWDISLDNETQCLWRLLYSLVHPKTQHLKSLFGADIVYLQQLQQVISNGGGPRLLTEDCVYAYRAASQMGLTFYPRWREQRGNLKPLVLRDCLWFVLDY